MANEDVVAVLTRAPAAGGKTRLFAALGIEPDVELLEALLRDTVDGASSPAATTVIVVTPASACDQVAAMLPQCRAIAQVDGGLGDRMRAAMATLFAGGARRVVLIGSDLPSITPSIVASAFAVLDHAPDAIVLGPARDGGYYLVAATCVPPIFDDIEWGAGTVLEQTRQRAASSGYRIHVLEPLSDIDTIEALRAVMVESPASRTAQWVRIHQG